MNILHDEKQPLLSNFGKLALVLFSVGLALLIIIESNHDENSVLIYGAVILPLFLTNLLLWINVLHLRITTYDVKYKYPPMINSWKSIPVEQIKEWEIQKYNWKDYGGWGYRKSISAYGWALTVINKNVLFLDRYDKKPIRIGTKNPEQVSAALAKMKERGNT